MRFLFGCLAICLFCASTMTADASEKLRRECYQHSCSLFFTGEIVGGDAAAIQNAILGSPLPVDGIIFNSPGGDALESVRIADVLNKHFVAFMTGGNTDGTCLGFSCGTTCASACALAYLMSNNRAGANVFLHRPTFEAETFRKMSGTQAELAYNRGAERLGSELGKRGVDAATLALIMSIPSDTVQKIRSNYPQYSPWMAEWLAAKCPTKEMSADSLLADMSSHVNCETTTIEREQRRAQHR